MKVFVAGAGGAIGKHLVPQLVKDGHDVVGMVRSQSKQGLVSNLGAEPVVADAFDADAVTRAVAEAKPEAIVHQLTSIPAAINLRRLDRDFALTNRLRTEGTDNLLAAAREAGARRFVAQSFAGWPYDPRGGGIKTEEDALNPEPVAPLRGMQDAIRHLEEAVTGADWIEGIILRYGPFYGPGTSLGADGSMTEMVRKRRVPVIGAGAGVWSFIHVADAAEATVAAVRGGSPGIYNIVDDDPAPVSEWLPALAEAVGAKPPMRIPRWLGRLGAGEAGVTMMTEAPGASNEKAKRELAWQPRYRSWRQGFAEALGWWQEHGRQELRELLMAEWDPIGVADAPEAYDEYDSYLEPLLVLLRGGADAAEIAEYLDRVEIEQMGLGEQAEQLSDQLLEVGMRIVKWYAASAD